MRVGGREGGREGRVREEGRECMEREGLHVKYLGADEVEHANEKDGEHEEAAHEEGTLGLGGGGGGRGGAGKGRRG